MAAARVAVVVGTATAVETAEVVVASGWRRPRELRSEGMWSAVAAGEVVARIAAQSTLEALRVR